MDKYFQHGGKEYRVCLDTGALLFYNSNCGWYNWFNIKDDALPSNSGDVYKIASRIYKLNRYKNPEQ